MISTFWFLVKISLTIIAFMALLSLDGDFTADIMDYSISMPVGVALFCLFCAVWTLSFLLKMIRGVLNTPKMLSRYNEKKSHDKGLQALAYGLSSVAANDVRMAKYHTKRAQKYMHQDYGLNHLLLALTSRLSGDTKQAEKSFQSLLNQPETAILGVKGLLQNTPKDADHRYARMVIDQSLEKNANQPWILKAQYQLDLKTQHYAQAIKHLERLKKKDIYSKADYTRDKALLLMLNDSPQKAYKMAPTSLPIALAYLEHLSTHNKRKKSLSIIRHHWTLHPHPKLLDYWIRYAPKKSISNPLIMAGWIEDLYHLNDHDASSALYCAEAMNRIHQMDQAKRFVKTAIDRYPTILSYQLMNKIDSDGGWLDYIHNAHHDKTWICSISKRIYPQWQPLSQDGIFGSIIWAYPDTIEPNLLSHQKNGLDQLL